MIDRFIWKYIYVIIFLIVFIVHYNIFWSIFTKTFNFADNLGYVKLIELFKLSLENGTPFYIPQWLFFVNEDYKVLFITPFWQILWYLFSYIMPIVVFINIAILWSLYLNILCSFKLFNYISRNSYTLSLLWAIIFWASSLVLYANWLNLMGLFFIPLVFLNIIKFLDWGKIRNFVYAILYFIFLGLCSTYFIPIIWVILIPLFILNIRNNIKKILSIISLLLISFIWIFYTYKIPFYFLESQWQGIEIEQLLDERKLKTSSLDALDILTPNNKNFLNEYQLKITRNLTSSDIDFFRYSNYLPIPLILLFILSFIISREKSLSTWREYYKIWIYISIIAFILFLWDRVIINGFDLWIKNILYYIKQLPNWEILRKSAYFFFAITFWLALIIVSNLSNYKHKDNSMIYFVFIIFILATSVWPYNTVAFDRKFYNSNINNIPDWSVVLSLPNSWYNNWEYQTHLLYHSNKLKSIEVWNATLPWYDRTILWAPQIIESLVYWNERFNYGYCDFEWRLDYVFLYKRYIENFFYYSDKSWIYRRTKNKIEDCTNIYLISEDSQVNIYKVIHENQ